MADASVDDRWIGGVELKVGGVGGGQTAADLRLRSTPVGGCEDTTGAGALGVTLGFLGVCLLLAPKLFGAATQAAPPALAVLCCLAASCTYVFAGLYARRFKAMGIAPLQLSFGQLAASSVMMLPIAGVVDRPWTLPVPHAAPLAALVGLAVISTALAYILYFRILARAGATNILLVTFLVPVTAILLSSAFLGEKLAAIHFAAMLLIGAGLAAIDGRLFAWLARRLI